MSAVAVPGPIWFPLLSSKSLSMVAPLLLNQEALPGIGQALCGSEYPLGSQKISTVVSTGWTDSVCS